MNKNTTAKLLFHMLLQGAMEFRQEYFEEEIRLQRELLFNGATDEKLATSREAQRKLLRKAETKSAEIKQRILGFNRMAERELQDLSLLSPEERKGFETIAKYMKTIAEEVSSCRDMPQLLLLIKMYNKGVFKEALQGLEDAIQPVTIQASPAAPAEKRHSGLGGEPETFVEHYNRVYKGKELSEAAYDQLLNKWVQYQIYIDTTAADGGDLGATGMQNSSDVSEDTERDEKPIQE